MMRSANRNFEAGSSWLRRFHFDLESGRGVIRDREGVAASSLEEAVAQARTVIAEMRDADDLAEPGTWALVVRDADGTTVERLTVE